MKKVSLFIFVLVIACFGLYAQPKITGGFPINITEAPWQVILKINNQFACGGTIIAPNYILTAKHCVAYGPNYLDALPASYVKVIAGITCKSEENSSNTFNVSRIILHPDPNVDAALLQLSTNLTFNSSRKSIGYYVLSNSEYYNVGTPVRPTGWGWTVPGNSSLANCLQAVNLNVISNQDASNALGTTLKSYEMAATGTGSVRQGACHGDSGGPLTTLLEPWFEPTLIGVITWGKEYCTGNNQNSPSVFLRVSHIRNWITNFICSTVVNFTDQTVSTNHTVSSQCYLYVKNVTVSNNAKLTLGANTAITIEGPFSVPLGSQLEVTNIVSNIKKRGGEE